jgi:RecJ-like exonuclease
MNIPCSHCKATGRRLLLAACRHCGGTGYLWRPLPRRPISASDPIATAVEEVIAGFSEQRRSTRFSHSRRYE